jgi:diguanylate cyclase (GGDEF)-like protein
MMQDELTTDRRSVLTGFAAVLGVTALALLERRLQPDVSLSVAYVVPIGVITWRLGARAGFICAGAAACAHAWSAFAPTHPYALSFAPYLSSILSAVFFFGVVVIGSVMRGTLHEERELARTDPLTGLGNRRFFADLAAIEISRTRRYRRSLTLAYIDVDHFKDVNDELGHAAGDALLVTVAEVLCRHLRTSDVMARVGGDEFAVILPETGLAGAKIAIEKAAHCLEKAMRENGWNVGFSIGVVASDAPASVEQMLEAADQAMYSVKKTGKGAIRYEVRGAPLEISA